MGGAAARNPDSVLTKARFGASVEARRGLPRWCARCIGWVAEMALGPWPCVYESGVLSSRGGAEGLGLGYPSDGLGRGGRGRSQSARKWALTRPRPCPRTPHSAMPSDE